MARTSKDAPFSLLPDFPEISNELSNASEWLALSSGVNVTWAHELEAELEAGLPQTLRDEVSPRCRLPRSRGLLAV
jgi:hypothetical protein